MKLYMQFNYARELNIRASKLKIYICIYIYLFKDYLLKKWLRLTTMIIDNLPVIIVYLFNFYKISYA